jgi:hypothetical protein
MVNIDRAKIHLSQDELQLVQNAEWLLTKNRIIGKVYEMFGYLIDEMQMLLAGNSLLSTEIFAVSPKISKGENYLGLPYVMLDYPRRFGKTDVFAVRTMFWWGHFFSTTLHLKGKYKHLLASAISKNQQLLSQHDFFISVHEDEWRHDFDAANYTAIQGYHPAMLTDNLAKKDFCKIAAKINLGDWEKVVDQLLIHYKIIFNQLMANFPADERGL